MVRLPYPPRDVLVALVGDTPTALEDACNHAGASLATGGREGDVVSCPLHRYRFDLRSGSLLSPRNACPAQRCLEAVIVGSEVHVYDPFCLPLSGTATIRTPQG
jgi:nitrite reductase/ring-hydroxylating ferredoxin subunit